MAKPIVIFLIKEFNNIDKIREHLEKKLDDYHVFVFESSMMDVSYRIETYYEKDFTEVQFAELKALIEEKLTGKELLKTKPKYF